ncbi:MAG: thioredoxin family protein [Sulfuricellaceae bacterium]|nr:thioredoxin family protein [Sulfuricellaceae bacterium]
MTEFEVLTEFDFHAAVAGSSGTALVLFGAPACGACRRMEAVLPRAVAETGVRLFKVDVQASTALAREYEIFHLPALFLFREGRYHAPLACQPTPEAIRQALAQALAQPAEEEP